MFVFLSSTLSCQFLPSSFFDICMWRLVTSYFVTEQKFSMNMAILLKQRCCFVPGYALCTKCTFILFSIKVILPPPVYFLVTNVFSNYHVTCSSWWTHESLVLICV